MGDTLATESTGRMAGTLAATSSHQDKKTA